MVCPRHQSLKALVCVYTSTWWSGLLLATCCLWSLFAFPKLLYPYCRNRVLPLMMAVALGKRQGLVQPVHNKAEQHNLQHLYSQGPRGYYN